MNLTKPKKIIIPLAEGLAWGNDGAIYQQKLDGKFCTRNWQGNLLAGELMPDDHFIAWDILSASDEGDCRLACTLERLKILVAAREHLASEGIGLVPFTLGNGGEFLQQVLEAGCEGVVRKLPDSNYYATMQACKRLQTWHCVVTSLDISHGSAAILDAATGENRGTCPLRNRAPRCRVGSTIKVEGLCLTKEGKIRDPRPCKDTPESWLIKF